MAIDIRDAIAADEGACAALLAELGASRGGATDTGFRTTYRELLSTRRGQIVVAEDGDSVLGMATVSFNLALRYRGEYCQLEELIVSPRARGQSLGGRLVQTVVDIASRRGCAEVGLYLVPGTEHNRGFYEKYGFEAVGSEMRQPLNTQRPES